MIFNELRKHSKLANKRHPMYEKNRFGKFFMFAMSLFWIGYLMFFGVNFAFIFESEIPHMEPYHILNNGLLIIWGLDFLSRFPFQKTPTQEIKPYLLLPVKKKRLIDFLLIRSGLHPYNLFWLFFFVPFTLASTIPSYFGLWGCFTFVLGIYLTFICNNYWFLLCRTLMRERIIWILLPVLCYGLPVLLTFVFDIKLYYLTRDLGEGFIEGNPLAFLLVIATIVILWLINRQVMMKLVYSEINKTDDTKVHTISSYGFLERYGEIGEYFRLELKLLMRNKRCRGALRSIAIIVVLFSAILSFADVYDSFGMSNFIAIYSFTAFGTVILTQIMGYEGNYIDGLMTRKESIYNLLKAKYYLYSMGVVIPFILMLPAIIMGKITLLSAVAYAFFAIGPIYFMLFQLAVYNTKTVQLNESVSGKQSTGTAFQNIIAVAAFGLPLALLSLLTMIFEERTSQLTMFAIGLAFTLTSNLWIKHTYRRFLKRRYVNMEGFRDTR